MGRILKVVAALIHGASPVGAWRSSWKDHNGADIRFVRAMITHHTQAVHMADLALQRTGDDRILTLARTIKLTRPGEVKRLSAWLANWSEAPPAAPHHKRDMNAGHHSGTGAMISDADLQEVQASEGPGFDRRWLRMMIQHHQRAVETAKTEQADGHSPDATRLARQLESSQSKIVSQMEACLKS